MLPYVSTSCVFFCESVLFWVATSSSERDDNEVEEGDVLGLSRGEILAEELGVESVVADLRRALSDCRAVVAMMEGVLTKRSGQRTGFMGGKRVGEEEDRAAAGWTQAVNEEVSWVDGGSRW